MRLDITVYKNVELVRAVGARDVSTDDWDLADEQDLIYLSNDEVFAARSDGMAEGFYKADEADRFRAGSYIGYGEFRKAVSMGALGVAAENVWRGHVSRGPMYELVQFTDCDGFLGPNTCAKLAADVTSLHRGRPVDLVVRQWLDRFPLGRGIEVWESFVAGFRTAGENNGVMRFH